MKVSKSDAKPFTPIDLTIETQQEFDIIHKAFHDKFMAARNESFEEKLYGVIVDMLEDSREATE